MKVTIPPLHPLPDRIDGVTTEAEGLRQAAFVPEGVLVHEYFPLEWVIIKEVGNDLSYSTTYWDVDRFWQAYIRDRGIYERLRDRFLLGQPVVVDYTDAFKLGIYIPKNKYISGIDELYKTMMSDLRELDRKDIERILKEQGYAEIEDTLASHNRRTGIDV